ncbi:DUF669 domain-containing protein [bacterium]|nr:DUF669 domain-containing protein [bacterium]
MATNEHEATTDIGADLADFDEAYETAPVEERGEVPDGKYQVRVERAELKRTKETRKPMLALQLLVAGPTHAGRKIFRNSVIGSEDNVRFLKQDLHTMGVNVPKLSALGEHLEEMVGLGLDVQVKTKDGYTNVYINGKCALPEGAAGGGTDFGFGANASDAEMSAAMNQFK